MHVNEERIKDNFLELVKLNSPSGKERIVANWLRDKFAQLGLEVEEDNTRHKTGSNTGNIIVRMPGKEAQPTLLLAAHMDVVAEMENAKVIFEDGIFRTDGNTILGADDKAGIVALLEVATVLREEELEHFPLELVFTVCEEIGLMGAKALEKEILQSQLGFIFDSSEPFGCIINQAPSKDRLYYRIVGKAAHAGVCPEEGINAIQIASSAIAKIPQGRIDSKTTCNIGKIVGGGATNIVPDKVEVWGEVRSLDKDAFLAQNALVDECFQQAARDLGGKVDRERTHLYPGFFVSPDSEVVKRGLDALERIGIHGEIASTGGGSDANILNAIGIPAINMGLGAKNPHSRSESIAFVDLCNLASFGLAIARGFS
jgi:tripeptide aminopeptidase